jgi:GNAT superfamily N-acetyltransferase
MQSDWHLRLARMDDVEQLEVLIPLSVRTLQAPYYTPAQMDAALGPVFGVDRQLIADGTYYSAVADGRIVGCGGWSKRPALYGGDANRPPSTAQLDPRTDAARVRAFFVHPNWARRGIGRAILAACEEAIRAAGFRRIEMIATLAGVPLYAACGYGELEPFEMTLEGGIRLPGMRMGKALPVRES